MSDETPTLDPDEVACPRCQAEPGQVCRAPSGKRAKTVHRERRDSAASTPRKPPRKGKRNAGTITKATAAARARKAAQARKRRNNEARAKAEAQRERAERLAAEELAHERAADVVAFDRARMLLKREILDTTSDLWERLRTAARGLQRVALDEEGRVAYRTVERFVNDRQVLRLVPDVRGAYSAADVLRLAQAAGLSLDKLRLEQGEPTEHHRHDGGRDLGDLSDAELRTFSDRVRAALDEVGNG